MVRWGLNLSQCKLLAISVLQEGSHAVPECDGC